MDLKGGQMNNTNRQPQRPAPAPQTPPSSGQPVRPEPQIPRPNGSRKRTWITVGVLVVVALIVAAVIVMWFARPAGGDASIQRDKYQAVFLTNGQVYFGKLANSGGDYMQLQDVYYLQVDQNVQGTGEGEQAETATQEESQVSLAKLGSELHGPEDAMQINGDQVLFWENLTDNSKVVSAIKQHTGQ